MSKQSRTKSPGPARGSALGAPMAPVMPGMQSLPTRPLTVCSHCTSVPGQGGREEHVASVYGWVNLYSMSKLSGVRARLDGGDGEAQRGVGAERAEEEHARHAERRRSAGPGTIKS